MQVMYRNLTIQISYGTGTLQHVHLNNFTDFINLLLGLNVCHTCCVRSIIHSCSLCIKGVPGRMCQTSGGCSLC